MTEKASKVFLDVCKDEILNLKLKAAAIPEGKALCLIRFYYEWPFVMAKKN